MIIDGYMTQIGVKISLGRERWKCTFTSVCLFDRLICLLELCLVSWLVVNYYTVKTRLSIFNFCFSVLLSVRNWQILRLVRKISYIFMMILYFILLNLSSVSVIIFLIDNYYDRNKISNRLWIFNILSFSYYIYFI